MKQNVTLAWTETLKFFQKNQPLDYDMWIILLNFISFKNTTKTLKVSVGNTFTREMINDKFKKKIEEVFSGFIQEEKIELEIIISDQGNVFEEGTVNKIQEKNKKPNDIKKQYESVEKLVSDKKYSIDINQKFTFDRFVVGENNKLAYSAATLVSQYPGKEYNPFFIYGGVGLGKTHLMQSIGNAVIKNKPELKVYYATTEQFLNDYVMAIKTGKIENFRAKYRQADVLLLDDIQFLESKDKLQEELFNTFNFLYQNNKQIVFTCDKPPRDLKNIEERILTRLSSGLTVDIKHPELETRKAIVIKKIDENFLSEYITTQMMDYLAENITTNIRDIESAVSKIKLLSLHYKTITIELLENHLSDILTPIRAKKRNLTPETIQREVANYYKVSYSDMKAQKRTKDISFPRQMAMYLTKEILKYSFSEIGNEFGGRDHSTVVASCKKAKDEIEKNPSIRNDYEELLKILSNF